MYGDIKKESTVDDEIKETALRLIQLVSKNAKFDVEDDEEADFESILGAAITAVTDVMNGIVHPEIKLPTSKDILETIRKMEI